MFLKKFRKMAIDPCGRCCVHKREALCAVGIASLVICGVYFVFRFSVATFADFVDYGSFLLVLFIIFLTTTLLLLVGALTGNSPWITKCVIYIWLVVATITDMTLVVYLVVSLIQSPGGYSILLFICFVAITYLLWVAVDVLIWLRGIQVGPANAENPVPQPEEPVSRSARSSQRMQPPEVIEQHQTPHENSIYVRRFSGSAADTHHSGHSGTTQRSGHESFSRSLSRTTSGGNLRVTRAMSSESTSERRVFIRRSSE